MRKSAMTVLALLTAMTAAALYASDRKSDTESARDEAADEAGIKIGQTVTVHLRGDAAGVAYHDRVVDLGNTITRKGVVERNGTRVLVLKDGDRRYHVPWASILVVESGGAKEAKKGETKERAEDAPR